MTTFPHSNGYSDSPRSMACVQTYPARSCWELELTSRNRDPRGAKELRDGDLLSCPEGLHTYTVGTVLGYCLRNGDDPVAGIDQARAHGHQLAWINQNAASISSSRRAPKVCIIIRDGDLIRLEGVAYRVKATHYHNLKLVREDYQRTTTEEIAA